MQCGGPSYEERMGTCLTPTAWSMRLDRRIAPLRTDVWPEMSDAMTERMAIWNVWRDELGGVTFVEPADRQIGGPSSSSRSSM